MVKDKVILVTGASRGIGAATARLLGEHGASVAVNYFQNQTAADQVVADIQAKGGKAVALQADCRDQSAVEEMVQKAEEALGSIDVLVANASITFPTVPFMEYPWDAFEAKLTGELKASFFTTRAVASGMIQRKKGSVIFISSSLSRYPGMGFCAHSTAKSALDSFGKSLALELGPHQIRVNVVAPGLTETDATRGIPKAQRDGLASMTPLGRVGLPEDVAGAVLFYASDASRFVSGSYLPVSGGIQMV